MKIYDREEVESFFRDRERHRAVLHWILANGIDPADVTLTEDIAVIEENNVPVIAYSTVSHEDGEFITLPRRVPLRVELQEAS